MAEHEQTTAPAGETPDASPIETEVKKIRAAHSDAIVGVEENPRRGMFWIDVKLRQVIPILRLLRDDRALDYKMLSDLTAVDRPHDPPRFTVLYNLYSVTRNRRLFIRTRVGEDEEVPTACELFPNADWAEREVYDLFGIRFAGHPDLRRIELPDDWDGHPLRKDYPLIGRRPVILYNDVKDVL